MKERKYNTEVLETNLFGYNDAYILERIDITIIGHNHATDVAFKNWELFTKLTTKVDITEKYDGEDLELAMSICNLLYAVPTILMRQFYCFIQNLKQLILMLILKILVKSFKYNSRKLQR